MINAISYRNDAVIEADRTTHTTLAASEAGAQGSAGSSRALAIVHLAMHDAYFSISPSGGAAGPVIVHVIRLQGMDQPRQQSTDLQITPRDDHGK
jgi:hypothetical protein